MAGPFDLALRQFAEKAGERADKVVRDVALEVWSRVVVRSPVDTGRFRANWLLQVDAMPEGAPNPGGTTASPAPPPEDPSIAVGEAAGHVIWIANNLPYALRLEYGYSTKKAPHGMVRLTLAEFEAIADKAAQEAQR